MAVFKAFSRNRLNSTVTHHGHLPQARHPWEFNDSDGFRWVGDEQVETAVLRPALSAIEDPRFASAKATSTRRGQSLLLALRLPQSVHQSGCAVESAMKAVLKHRGVPYEERDTAFKLFDHLVSANLVPEYMKFCVLATASPRNKVGGHGADEEPHRIAAGDQLRRS